MSFGYYKTFTTDHTQCGSADSTDFPICINITDADLKTVANGGYVQNSNGYDIRPYSDSILASALTFELVYYVPTTGQLEMHVKVGTLSKTTDLVSYLAFGDASITTNGSSTSTWDSNFKGVWHLSETSFAASSSHADSTSGASPVTVTGSGVTSGTGRIAGGAGLPGNSTNYLSGANSAALNSLIGDFTLSAWVNPTDYTNYNGILGKTGGIGSTFPAPVDSYLLAGFGYFVILQGDNNSLATIYRTTSQIPTGVLTHIVGIGHDFGAASRSAQLYINAVSDTPVQVSTGTFTPTASSSGFYLGTRNDLFTNFTGVLDEIRISNTQRSSSWITAEYNNQKSSSTFLTWGTRTVVVTGGGKKLAALGVG